MIYALILLASLAHSQEVSSDTAQGLNIQDAITADNTAKAVYALQSGRPKITGIPRFIKGICFDVNGTNCQTTAATAGGPVLISTFCQANSGSTTQAAFNVAFATAQATFSGNYDVMCWLTAIVKNSGANACMSSLLVNSGPISPLVTAGPGLSIGYDAAGGSAVNLGGVFRIPKASASGLTKLAITFASNGGTTCSWPTSWLISATNPFLYCSEVQ